MSTRDAYEPGVPCWIDTLPDDVGPALAFYRAVFGWEFEGNADGTYFVARLRGRDVAGVGARPDTGPAGPGWNTYVAVERVDEAIARARTAGATVPLEPFDVLPAGRVGVLADPTGAPLGLWEAGARRGAQLVNEPSAWAMSQLSTPDPDAAATFYGELFGWTTEPFSIGDGVVTMFRLPGYVGGEPEQPVSREVVATMAAADGPAHWSADFWVADVDAAAAAAEGTGGGALVGPFDGPMGRRAVLADPAGAAFSVSRVVP